MTITWKYPIDDENGMPDAEVNHSQIELEDALEVLDSPRVSFQMLVVTGNGRKEWHWYVADLDMWMKRMNALISDHPVFPIDIVNSYQPQWSLYHDFISGLE